MPASSRRSGTFSPPLSSTASYSPAVSPKLNVVSRLAIRGKAEPDADLASIRLFLRLSLPLDSISPGMTIPLFPEENIRIRDFKVHPLDANYVPYNFSSSSSPLLNSAARALSLPRRSTRSYLSLFSSTQSSSTSTYHRDASTSRVPSTNGSIVPHLEERYTGYILVSGYNVCYVVPKEFPDNVKALGNADNSDGESISSKSTSRTPFQNRRHSIGDKTVVHFMAALDISVPYLSKPPKAPFLLSIPLPKCLSNSIKISIPSLASTTASFASLSSEEEPTGWDLSSDPHVTRWASKHLSRPRGYSDFADDESSDSSNAGSPGGYGVQGTFTSTDCIHIRWASPLSSQGIPDHGDGRRRVGVHDVQGETTYTVLSQDADGIRMRLNYSGTCKGVWFPGVATMLGLDVVLDAKGSVVTWSRDHDHSWNVDGGKGFTGFDVGSSKHALSRQSSFDSPNLITSHSNPPGPSRSSSVDDTRSPSISRRQTDFVSSASLLRVPLPQQNVEEYSFENSATPTSSAVPSSVSSLTPSSSINRLLSPEAEDIPRPPCAPMTIHLNMNELLPTYKNGFTFNISGTIVVLPSASTFPAQRDLMPGIVLPAFHVLTAETEIASKTVRSQAEGCMVEIANASSTSRSLTQTRKTVLRFGSQTKCDSDSALITLRTIVPQITAEEDNKSLSHRSSQTPDGTPKLPSATPSRRSENPHDLTHFRDGPLIIPWLVIRISTDPLFHAVVLRLPAPVDAPSEWLEFGLTMPQHDSSLDKSLNERGHLPEVEIASVSIADIPVRFETFQGSKQEDFESGLPPESNEMAKQECLMWVRIHAARSGTLEVVYIVREHRSTLAARSAKGIKVATDTQSQRGVFMPLFSLPIGRLEVVIEKNMNTETLVASNMRFQQDRPHEQTLSRFAVEPFFHISLVVHHRSISKKQRRSAATRILIGSGKVLRLVPTMIALLSLAGTMKLSRDLQHLQMSLQVSGDGRTEWTAPGFGQATTTIKPTIVASTDRWGYTETLSTSTTSPVYPAGPAGSRPQYRPYFDGEPRQSPVFTLTPAPAPSTSVSNALLPMHYVPLSWGLRPDWNLDEFANTMMTKMEKVWNLLQVVFHWPLSPE